MTLFGQMIRRMHPRSGVAPGPAAFMWRYFGNTRRTALAQSTANVFADTTDIAAQMKDRGIVVGPTSRFLGDEGREALPKATEMIRNRSRDADVQEALARGFTDFNKDYVFFLVPWACEHAAGSPLLRLALDTKLLEIISGYLGLWPRLHAIGGWLNFPTAGESKSAQLWHRDPEDLSIVKVFIYLNDVDTDRGPFSYIPTSHPPGRGAARMRVPEHHTRITDDEMAAAFPRETWQVCTGPAETMILADTVGFHRGGKVANGQRLLITFTYTSGTPYKDRKFTIAGEPDWMSSDIQRFALRGR